MSDKQTLIYYRVYVDGREIPDKLTIEEARTKACREWDLIPLRQDCEVSVCGFDDNPDAKTPFWRECVLDSMGQWR